MPARFADYHFVEQATLRFASSEQTPGIQAADVIAGFVMRYMKSVLHDRVVPDPVARDIFDTLMDFTNPVQGLGVNFVLTNHDVVRLGVQPL